MPDQTKRVDVLYGPYAGRQIDLDAADADAAISDGWARDPYAVADPKAEAPEYSQETYDKAVAAAEKAARKLRGEPEPGEDMKAKKTTSTAKKPEAKSAEDATKTDDTTTKTSAIQADTDTSRGYETRATRTPKS